MDVPVLECVAQSRWTEKAAVAKTSKTFAVSLECHQNPNDAAQGLNVATVETLVQDANRMLARLATVLATVSAEDGKTVIHLHDRDTGESFGSISGERLAEVSARVSKLRAILVGTKGPDSARWSGSVRTKVRA